MFAARLRAHRARQDAKDAAHLRLARQVPRWQAVWRPETGRVSDGDDRCARYLWLLDNLGFVRNQDQVDFHWPFFYALLPRFYGKDWRRESARVLDQWGLARIDLYVLAIAQRRLGKTTAVCLAQAAAIATIGGLNQAVLATNMRITTIIRDSILAMLGSRPEFRGQFWTSKDKLIFSHVPRVDDAFHVPWMEKAFSRAHDRPLNGVDERYSSVTAYPGNSAKGKHAPTRSRRSCSPCVRLFARLCCSPVRSPLLLARSLASVARFCSLARFCLLARSCSLLFARPFCAGRCPSTSAACSRTPRRAAPRARRCAPTSRSPSACRSAR